MIYTFHTDPGHGWLEVPAKELKDLGIAGDISHYSYVHGDKVFLEEDCDAGRFLMAKKAKGEEFQTRESYKENTPIRNYARYSA